MKKPLKKDYCTKFSLDSNFVRYDSKKHAEAQSLFIEHQEMVINELKHALKINADVIEYWDTIDNIGRKAEAVKIAYNVLDKCENL